MLKEKKNRKRNKWLTEKRKKWLTKRAFSNCLLISIGVVVISYVFEIARMTITELPFPKNIVYGWFTLIFLTVGLWILGFLFPEIMETIFSMLGFKEKEENKDNDQNS